MVEAYKAQYENLIVEYRARISELVKENSELVKKIEEMTSKESLIVATLERAEKTSL